MFDLKDKRQRSLLAYLETCAVDKGGRVNQKCMSESEVKQADLWHQAGFIRFGRISSDDVTRDGCYWVELTDLSWRQAARIRMERGKASASSRTFKTTNELKFES